MSTSPLTRKEYKVSSNVPLKLSKTGKNGKSREGKHLLKDQLEKEREKAELNKKNSFTSVCYGRSTHLLHFLYIFLQSVCAISYTRNLFRKMREMYLITFSFNILKDIGKKYVIFV